MSHVTLQINNLFVTPKSTYFPTLGIWDGVRVLSSEVARVHDRGAEVWGVRNLLWNVDLTHAQLQISAQLEEAARRTTRHMNERDYCCDETLKLESYLFSIASHDCDIWANP